MSTSDITDPGRTPEEILAALRKVALRTAKRHLNDAATAEDVAQDVMVAVLRRGLDGLEDPAGYVAVPARNAAFDALRARRREWDHVLDDVNWLESMVDNHTGPAGEASRADLFRLVLAPLSEKQRLVFLASLDGLSNAEIAARFGYAGAGAVGVTLTRIRKLIREPFIEEELRSLVSLPLAEAIMGAPPVDMDVDAELNTAPTSEVAVQSAAPFEIADAERERVALVAKALRAATSASTRGQPSR